jgi:hypothetical protein
VSNPTFSPLPSFPSPKPTTKVEHIASPLLPYELIAILTVSSLSKSDAASCELFPLWVFGYPSGMSTKERELGTAIYSGNLSWVRLLIEGVTTIADTRRREHTLVLKNAAYNGRS